MAISKNTIKHIAALQHKKFREQEQLFVAEGHKCVSELQRSFACVHHFVAGQNATDEDIKRMSSLKTPQGEIGVFRLPDYQHSDLSDIISNNLLLVLDAVQDPGNMGTIIRTADWFGIKHIVCSADTVDCFSPKVVQSTMGSLARVKIYYTDLPIWLKQTISQHPDLPIYGTLLDGESLYQPSSIEQKNNGIIIMGNEGNGISAPIQQLITHPILIPPFNPTQHIQTSEPNTPTTTSTTTSTTVTTTDHPESLNVAIATAIILAEFRRP